MHAFAFVVPVRKLKPFGHLPIVLTGPDLLSTVPRAPLSNHFTLSRNQDNKLLCKSTQVFSQPVYPGERHGT